LLKCVLETYKKSRLLEYCLVGFVGTVHITATRGQYDRTYRIRIPLSIVCLLSRRS